VPLLAVVLLAACGKAWVVTYESGDSAGPVVDLVLTADSGDSYTVDASGDTIHAEALPGNNRENLRVLFWPAGAPSVDDSQSCATWSDQTETGMAQQGAAVRVETGPTGVTRAITVTKNILFGYTWVFNIHTWDTSKPVPLTEVAQIDLQPTMWRKPLPWHLCLRAVGDVVFMKVWAGSEPEPEWGDTSHGSSVSVGPEWVYPGTAGWYIGHLPAGGFADFTDLTTWKYVDAEPLQTSRSGSADRSGAESTSTDGVRVSIRP
jgi:hypothetical protein